MGILELARVRAASHLASSTPAEIEADKQAVAELRDRGVDLSRSRELRHQLYLPTLLAALGVAERLKEHGYRAEILFNPVSERERFLVRASHRLVISLYAVTEARERLTALAASCGGAYGGWEGVEAR